MQFKERASGACRTCLDRCPEPFLASILPGTAGQGLRAQWPLSWATFSEEIRGSRKTGVNLGPTDFAAWSPAEALGIPFPLENPFQQATETPPEDPAREKRHLQNKGFPGGRAEVETAVGEGGN